MARTRDRLFAWVGVILFLISSVAFSGLVLWQMRQENQQQKELEDAQTALNQTGQETDQTNQTNTPQEDAMEPRMLENFTPVSDVSELQITDLTEGTGEVVAAGATVTAHYTGALAKDGTIFESSKDTGQPATFPLSGVIAGWQQGVPGMKVGGVRRLVIPAAQAYGEAGSPPAIGPNEPLVFDIEMVSVQQ